MARDDARKLRAFQRQTVGYERALLRRIRSFINRDGDKLARLAMVNDWDEFHNIVAGLEDEMRKVLAMIYKANGERTIEELK